MLHSRDERVNKTFGHYGDLSIQLCINFDPTTLPNIPPLPPYTLFLATFAHTPCPINQRRCRALAVVLDGRGHWCGALELCARRQVAPRLGCPACRCLAHSYIPPRALQEVFRVPLECFLNLEVIFSLKAMHVGTMGGDSVRLASHFKDVQGGFE